MNYSAALVTGAATRLGRAMALALGARGIDVAVHYCGSADAAAQTVADIKALGVNAVALHADLLVEDDMQALLPAAVATLGKPLDVLINNASVFDYDRLETATLEGWERHHNSNLRAPFVLTQAFADQAGIAAIEKAGEAISTGCIINMVDQRLRKLTPEFMTYTLAKSGLWTLTQTAARALAPRIRVNAIGPGPTLIGARQSDKHFAHQRANTLLQRGSNPADIVGAMVYFLDAPSVTGQLICVDGGQHLGWQTPDIQGVG